MRFKFLIIPSVFMFQVVSSQTDSVSSGMPGGTTTKLASRNSADPVIRTDQASSLTSPTSTQSSSTSSLTAIMDYKSVYETSTVEEEVKMAAERFNLTPSQQDVWLTAATERREGERQAHGMLDSKAANYEKEGAYKGLKFSQNTFYETIIGYLTPAQKQALEADRVIMNEKQKRLAKLPPPPAPSTVTAIPVDSAAIKQAEKEKATAKKSKKKKQAASK